MALILLADRYACESVLMHFKPLSIDDVKEYLASSKSVDMSERAFDWLLDWINENIAFFQEENQTLATSKVWGKINSDKTVLINKNVLTRSMRENGYEFDACKKDWLATGKLVRNSDGKFSHLTSVGKVKCRYIKIQTEKPNEFFQVEDDSDLPFD